MKTNRDEKIWTEGDYTIRYDERVDKFVVDQGEEKELATRDTLSLARIYCENREKRLSKGGKAKFEPVKAYLGEGYGSYSARAVIVTSVCDEGGVWIKDEATGEREKKGGKYSSATLWVRDAEADALVAQMVSYRLKAAAMEEQARVTLKKLKPLNLTEKTPLVLE